MRVTKEISLDLEDINDYMSAGDLKDFLDTAGIPRVARILAITNGVNTERIKPVWTLTFRWEVE